MTILALDLATVPNYLTYPAHDEVRGYLLRDLEMAAVKLGIATPPTQPGGEWDLLAGMFATATDIQFSSLQLSNAKADPVYAEDDDLDAIRERLGLPEIPPHGATGNVTATVDGPCVYLAGLQITFPGGLRGAVLTDTTFAVAGSGAVPIAMIDTGLATNFPAGTPGSWVNGPINSRTKATVAADFEGGSDTESDADKRLRILDAIQLPQLYGSLQWIISQVQAFPAAQYGAVVPDQVYVYRAPGGPGTFVVVVMQTGTVANGGARVIGDTTLAALRTYLSGLVPPEIHFDVRSVGTTQRTTSLYVAFTGARNTTNWADAVPWPTRPTSVDLVSGWGPSGLHTLLNVDAQTPPPVGAKVRLSDGTQFRDVTVASYSGSAGAYSVVMNEDVTGLSMPVALYPQIAAVGTSVEDLWYEAMGTLACGELTTDARLPQCRRFPGTALGGQTDALFGAIKSLETLMGSAALNLAPITASFGAPESMGVADSPFVQVPYLFAAYKSPYS